MKNLVIRGLLVASVALVGARGLDALALGETGSMLAHRDAGYTGDVGGGEFGISDFSSPSLLAPIAAPVKVTGLDFQTFCAESNLVSLPHDGPIALWTLDDQINGVTPIEPETAYLFTTFWNGDAFDATGHAMLSDGSGLDGASASTLHSYTYDYVLGAGRASSATDLQEAIWWLQGQWQGAFATMSAGARELVNIATLQTTAGGEWFVQFGANGIGNVRALVTTDANGSETQDVLVLVANGGGRPAIRLTKTADPAVAAPFQPITYSYLVENIGNQNLDDVIVTDDNGTPSDTTDDFQLGPVSIAAGHSHTFTKTVVLPIVDFCDTIGGVPDTKVGTLITQILPGGDVKVTYLQSETVANDNRYGTGATAATGWPSGHKFGALTGSDKCEFRFKDANGNVVLDFFADYITSANSATFPSGTVNYPSHYGTLGCTGGDGSVVTGSAANVLSVTTSLSDCLNLPQFQALNLVNSPPETAPLSGISIPAGWNYENSYTVVVSAAAFGASGFGSVEIPALHDSPPKTGKSNLITPEPCDTTVTNTAVVTATVVSSGLSVTASATATVTIGEGSGGGPPSGIAASIVKFDKHKVLVALTNHGTATATIGALDLDWPAGNKKLRKIKKGGAVLFDTKTSPTTVTVSTWKGKLADRQVPAGGTLTLTFEFEADASSANSDYGLSIDFGGGFVVLLP